MSLDEVVDVIKAAHGCAGAMKIFKECSLGTSGDIRMGEAVENKCESDFLDKLKAHPELSKETAFLVTFDEGGGFWDSGFFQPLDFFGDGPRIPLIAVSPFSRGGHISHTYTDHVSILKFIERNWGLKPLTARSRDNFPNPVVEADNPYVPLNSPALGDLFDLFNFPDQGSQDGNSQ